MDTGAECFYQKQVEVMAQIIQKIGANLAAGYLYQDRADRAKCIPMFFNYPFPFQMHSPN